ncbi:DUF4870 family protein [Pseudoduganella namucuonensis]|uniref:Uncharacterized membrane protein n=1 Tax=Pseudoduganella namucuonensis TaxID=1035707 RepID=A0A1I7L568_9BURK|nr:hypothetical protein [Pseudoduganella namucuonensis]SFV04850.1 Uncharacterized membrane protein [Pseudoduganella namucuonensis]
MASELVFDTRLESAKNTAWWLYIVHAVSFVFSLGAFSFIPLIINYVKRSETEGTFVYTHHSWQIRSFWWYLVWMVIGGVCWLTIIGIPLAMLIWAGAWLWKAYRLIKGIVDLNNNRAMP